VGAGNDEDRNGVLLAHPTGEIEGTGGVNLDDHDGPSFSGLSLADGSGVRYREDP
jgi:hypothetical protein